MTARALLLRDDDRGLEGFLRRGGFRGIALQQRVAAQTMEKGVGRAVAYLLGERKARRRGRQRVVEASSHGLKVSNKAVEQRREELIASFQKRSQRLPKVVRARPRVEKAAARMSRVNLTHERKNAKFLRPAISTCRSAACKAAPDRRGKLRAWP